MTITVYESENIYVTKDLETGRINVVEKLKEAREYVLDNEGLIVPRDVEMKSRLNA